MRRFSAFAEAHQRETSAWNVAFSAAHTRGRPALPDIHAFLRGRGGVRLLPGHAGERRAILKLFRPDRGVAAGAAGGRDDGHAAVRARRGGVHVRIDAGGRAEHAVGFGEFVAERFPGLAGGGAVGHGGAVRAVLRGAVGRALRGWRRGRLRRRRR